MSLQDNNNGGGHTLTVIPDQEFVIGEKLGEGTYGTVFAAVWKEDKKPDKRVAYKQVTKIRDETLFQQELSILATVAGLPHVVELLGIVRDYESTSHFIVPKAMIFNYVRNESHKSLYFKLKMEDIRIYIKHLLEGLAHLHDKEIIHCDVKPGNLAIDTKAKNLVLLDLGHSQWCSNPDRPCEIGTRVYRAPELLVKYPFYTSAVDVWAVGRIMADMLMPQLTDALQGGADSDSNNPKPTKQKVKEQIDRLITLYGPKNWSLYCRNLKKLQQSQSRSQCKSVATNDYRPLDLEHFFNKNIEAIVQKPKDVSDARARLKYVTKPEYKDAFNLVEFLLSLDFRLRPTCREALAHPFFRYK